jgi:t-SNARE complex subunit (syntaxin)
MGKTERTCKELLNLINEMQRLQHNKNENVKEVAKKPQANQNHYETKKNNELQKWLIESIMNKSFY